MIVDESEDEIRPPTPAEIETEALYKKFLEEHGYPADITREQIEASIERTGQRLMKVSAMGAPPVILEGERRLLAQREAWLAAWDREHPEPVPPPAPPEPLRRLECYLCHTEVERDQHDSTQEDVQLVMDEYDGHGGLTDLLGLVHCQGPPEQFDEQDRVVVCPGCLIKGLAEKIRKDAVELDGP